jgi:hypothetical protein
VTAPARASRRPGRADDRPVARRSCFSIFIASLPLHQPAHTLVDDRLFDKRSRQQAPKYFAGRVKKAPPEG